MPLDPKLKELLACPKCKGGLEIDEPKGELRCKECRLAYPLREGLPIFVLDEARPLER
jgi:uncharacterized protein YbaR (Trm112 family)